MCFRIFKLVTAQRNTLRMVAIASHFPRLNGTVCAVLRTKHRVDGIAIWVAVNGQGSLSEYKTRGRRRVTYIIKRYFRISIYIDRIANNVAVPRRFFICSS